MNKNYILLTAAAFLMAFSSNAQTFHKGSFLIGVTEGSTWSHFSTRLEPTSGGRPIIHDEFIHGNRDPLTLEYGLSKHWGIGISSGTDIFTINPNNYFFTDNLPSEVKAMTAEFTINTSYHFLSNAKADLSATFSFGTSSVNIKGKYSDQNPYQYIATGGIIRVGAHARYYFYKRLGAIGMLTAYTSGFSTKDVKGNTFGNTISTDVKGYALEFGFCYRIGK